MSILNKLKRKKDAPKVNKKTSKDDIVVEKIEKKDTKDIKETIKETKTSTPVVTASNIDAYKIILHPLVTEKSTLEETHGRYTFVVALDASKIEIRLAIRAMYGVMPKKVRTMHYEGKRMKFGNRLGRRSDWKKTIVTLPKGKTIDAHEGV